MFYVDTGCLFNHRFTPASRECGLGLWERLTVSLETFHQPEMYSEMYLEVV
jgi:hypothetical protein